METGGWAGRLREEPGQKPDARAQWVWLGHRMGGKGQTQGREHLECGGKVMGHPGGLAPGVGPVLWREGLPWGLDLWASGARSS